MANIITGMRIVCSVILLFFSPFSIPFYVLYIISGLSDMIDGTVARKTGTAGKFGSVFDTAADFVFVIVCLIKLLPLISIPFWVYGWIMIIAVIKIINIVSGFVMRKGFLADHSIKNKVTGALVFFWPLTISFINISYSAAAVCAVATVAGICEGYRIITGKI